MIVVLYKTADCGVAIKVQRFWREKSGAHAAMFLLPQHVCCIRFDVYHR